MHRLWLDTWATGGRSGYFLCLQMYSREFWKRDMLWRPAGWVQPGMIMNQRPIGTKLEFG